MAGPDAAGRPLAQEFDDTHGHASGDAALQWVARGLHEQVRSEDTVGRLDGGEFGVVAEVADRDFSRLLQKLHSAADGFEPGLRISVGAVSSSLLAYIARSARWSSESTLRLRDGDPA